MQLQTHFTLTPHYSSPCYLGNFSLTTVFSSFATKWGKATCLYLQRLWSHSCVPVAAFAAKYLIFNSCDWVMFFPQWTTLTWKAYKYSGSVESKTNVIFRGGNLDPRMIIGMCTWFECEGTDRCFWCVSDMHFLAKWLFFKTVFVGIF